MTRSTPDVELKRDAAREACVGEAHLKDGRAVLVMVTDRQWREVFQGAANAPCDDPDALWACWQAARAPDDVVEKDGDYRLAGPAFIEQGIHLGYPAR